MMWVINLNSIKSMYVNSLACVRVNGGESEGGENGSGEERSEIFGGGKRLTGLLYADDLVLFGESEKDLRAMMGRFAEVCGRRSLKINAGKSKVMVKDGEMGLECEVCADEIHLEHVSEFKYMGSVLDESGTDEAECRRKVASGRRVAGAIRSLVMLGVCSLSVLGSCMSHCRCLFLRMLLRR